MEPVVPTVPNVSAIEHRLPQPLRQSFAGPEFLPKGLATRTSQHKKARIVKALSPGESLGAVYTPYPMNERRLARRCRRGRPEEEAVPDDPDAPPDAPADDGILPLG